MHHHDSQVYNPPNATPIIVEKIPEHEYLKHVVRLRDRRQSLLVKQVTRGAVHPCARAVCAPPCCGPMTAVLLSSNIMRRDTPLPLRTLAGVPAATREQAGPQGV
jgi:hypothetical protein